MSSKAPELERLLARLLRHSPLDKTEQEAVLFLRGQSSCIEANIDILRPGDQTDRAFLVVEGVIGRVVQLHDGRRQITALHIAGEICNLPSVVLPTVQRSFQALSSSVVLSLACSDLRHVARQHPAIAEAFWRECASDESIVSQWVVNVGRRDARTRTAHLLCEMGLRMERAGLGMRVRYLLDVTQTHLADALGLTDVHVNRMLQGLRQDGLLEGRNRDISIPDWRRLAKVGQFDGAYLATSQFPRVRSMPPRHRRVGSVAKDKNSGT